MQDHTPVWESIIERFKRASTDPIIYDDYRHAFIEFSGLISDNQENIPFGLYSEMMHIAIGQGDEEMACAIINAALCEELWNADEEWPEWSVWLAVFSDKDFSEVRNCKKALETIKELRDNFTDTHILEKTDNLTSYLNH